MQVGRFLVHVYHRRHDIFPAYPVGEEVRRPLEKRLYLFCGFPLEKLRAGCYQRIDKPGAILAGAAPCLLNPALNEVVVASLRLDDMEIVFTTAGVNVGVAGVFVFLPFVMGFQRPCRVALSFQFLSVSMRFYISLLPHLEQNLASGITFVPQAGQKFSFFSGFLSLPPEGCTLFSAG